MVEKIQTLCHQFGITMTALERELKMGRGTISKWDKSSPSINNLKKVADFFHVSLSYFL